MPFATITPQASPQPNLELGAAIARVHVEGWREAYGHLLGERFYDDAALATRTEQWAAIGSEPATLWVAEDNPRARGFYARNGFTPDGTRKVDEAADDLAEIRMVRDPQ